MVRLSEADRKLLDSAFKRARERQNMTQRTIDETGRDVLQQRGRQVVEVLYLRPCPIMGWEAEWLPFRSDMPAGWACAEHMRYRIILDNET